MDDSCAVCADPLEWVAYGPCGHRDVCSTCVVRLRFICDDRRCCICKSESSVIFVTKALGDYTRMISDFSLLPVEPREGRVRSYWYHEDTQAFFDDVDHYKMIKAMCRLSCSVCDKDEEEGGPPHTGGDGPKRRPARFKNVEHLKGHLFHKHKLIMCSLCLEGRKVFICEQKLYTRAQLNQHISTGDSEVDGSESERGGFAGHPMCEFCKSPFYGDNELYSHMSTEHYTCHICQRQHPGQYEYYKNYDDLEMHFRRDHFLCEDEGCLAKKFVVFDSEGEMKRHDTLEHGGRMSRSQRNAALQIPTSFRYRSGAEQEQHRGRGRIFRRDESDNQLHMAIEASFGTAQSEALSRDHSSASNRGVVSDPRNMDDIDPLIQPFESLTATGTDLSRYRQALGRSSGIRPDESAFPPLSIASSSSQQNSMNLRNEGLPNNTMPTQLRRKNNRKANARENLAQAWPAAIQGRVSNSARQVIESNSSSASRSSTSGPASSGYPSLPQARTQVQAMPSTNNGQPFSALTSNMMNSGRISHSASAPNSTGQVIGSNSSSTSQNSTSGPASSGYPSLPQARTQVQARPNTNNGWPSSALSLTSNVVNSGRISHSASAPNLAGTGSSQRSISDFPPITAAVRKLPSDKQVLLAVADVQSANKSLVEKLRSALEYDDDRYTSFKEISGQYRQGLLGTSKYLDFVQQYGLQDLVFDLAMLCPDPLKQKELVDTYNVRVRSNGKQENGSKKGKAPTVEAGSSRERLADNVINTVGSLQSQFKPQEEEVEELSRDGYRAAKGPSGPQVESRGQTGSTSSSIGSVLNGKDSTGGGKVKKKTSKFNRVRLGDGSIAALLDGGSSAPEPGPNPLDEKPGDSLPVRGVWRKGGVQKLFL